MFYIRVCTVTKGNKQLHIKIQIKRIVRQLLIVPLAILTENL